MTASSPHERIGPTAHYTAYVWHRAKLPYADLFATRAGAALYWGFFAAGEWATRFSTRTPSMRVYLEYRHRLIEAVCEAHRPDVLIELGAGLTRRAVTFAADRGVRAVELDLPGMVRTKAAALARGSVALQSILRERHELAVADVTAEDFAVLLRAKVGDASRPVVVAEGLLSYLSPQDRAGVFASVAAALPPGGLFVCDLHTRAEQARVGRPAAVLRAAIRLLTRRKQALGAFETRADVERAFLGAGFAQIEFVQPKTHQATQPRLRRLYSPTHVVAARMGVRDPAATR